MWLYLAPTLSLLGVLVGFWLARPQVPRPLPLTRIANTAPPTVAELEPPRFLFAEPASCDYFIPARGDSERSAEILRKAVEWYTGAPRTEDL